MQLTTTALALAASLPLASAQLDYWAKKAGLLYFGAATDTAGQRERAGFQATYATYDSIFRDPKQFGSTTPTNGMKFMFTQPEKGVFDYTEGEVVAKLAAETNKSLRCHALLWHNQLSPWFTATNWTADTLREAIVTHVTNVAGHWKGRCYAWDVVNEALDEDGSYRKSVFYNVLGPEFIKIAFKAAAAADPTTKLYYNDYGIERMNNKSVGVRRIVQMLKDDGIKIDGVGLQAHLHALNHPTAEDHIAVMKSYAALGVDVAVTELDVRIQLPVNATNLAGQSESYSNVVTACVKVKQCVGITIWDFYDPFSWVPFTFPGQGEALLWFANFTVHPAYNGMIETLKTLAGTNARGTARL